MDKIAVYTDGSALSNGRPGSGCGWACKLMYKGQARMKSGGAIGETNNRMEMQAVLEAMKSITDKTIPVPTLSVRVPDMMLSQHLWPEAWRSALWYVLELAERRQQLP